MIRKKLLSGISILLSMSMLCSCGSVSFGTPSEAPNEHTEDVNEEARIIREDEPAPDTSTVDRSDDEFKKLFVSIEKEYDGVYSYDEDYLGMTTGTTGAAKSIAIDEIAMASNDAAAIEEEIGLDEEISYDAEEEVEIDDAAPESTAGEVFIEDLMAGIGFEQYNRDGYEPINEHGFVSAKTTPLSTFGADMDTATYANLRRSIFEGAYDDYDEQDMYNNRYLYGYWGASKLEESAIRIEEMINYFDYDYPDPKNGEKFSVSKTLTECPWNEDTLLFRVAVKTEEVKPENGSNIVFLIDTSGSMFDNNKLPLVKKAFKILEKSLTDKDRISIVTYAGTSEVLLEGVKGNNTEKIDEALDSMEAWGSTNGSGGIEEAYRIAKENFIEGGNNRVILATDGDFNVGVSSEAGLLDLITEKKESGIMLSCLGFGEGNYMDDKMELLADHGNGNYSFIDCSSEAEKVLKKEFWSTVYTVAKDTKFQVDFNPAKVKAYRQIGYENRQMAAEDFADDTKDGGEVGSGTVVTVLYEIIPFDSDYEFAEPESKYQENAISDSDDLLTVNIRYKEPDEDKSQLLEYPVEYKVNKLDNNTSWAAGVAQIGMLLRGSEYSGTSTYENVYDRLKQTPQAIEDKYRLEFLYLINRLKEQKPISAGDEDADTDVEDPDIEDDVDEADVSWEDMIKDANVNRPTT